MLDSFFVACSFWSDAQEWFCASLSTGHLTELMRMQVIIALDHGDLVGQVTADVLYMTWLKLLDRFQLKSPVVECT